MKSNMKMSNIILQLIIGYLAKSTNRVHGSFLSLDRNILTTTSTITDLPTSFITPLRLLHSTANRHKNIYKLPSSSIVQASSSDDQPRPPRVTPKVSKNMLRGEDVKEDKFNAPFFMESTDITEQDTDQVVKDIGEKVIKEYVSPIFGKEIEKGVPKDIIKGAAVSGVGLTVLAGQGAMMATAAGLAASYVAVTPGPTGDVIRVIGELTWDTTESIYKILKVIDANKKVSQSTKVFLSSMIDVMADDTNVRQAVLDAEKTEKFVTSKSTGQIDKDIAEISRIVEEVEDIMAKVDSDVTRESKKRLSKNKKSASREQERKVEETLSQEIEQLEKALKLEEEKLQEEIRLAEEALKEEEERLKQAEAIAMKAEEEAARIKAENEDKLAKEAEAARVRAKQEEKRAASEATRIKLNVETAEMEMTDIAAHDTAKKSKTAKLAVKTPKKKAKKVAKKSQMVEDISPSEDANGIAESLPEPSILGDGADIEMIAKAARAAVHQYEKEQSQIIEKNGVVLPESDEGRKFSDTVNGVADEEQDYEKLTVVQLKDILRSRGLKVSGRKAELIERLRS